MNIDEQDDFLTDHGIPGIFFHPGRYMCYDVYSQKGSDYVVYVGSAVSLKEAETLLKRADELFACTTYNQVLDFLGGSVESKFNDK